MARRSGSTAIRRSISPACGNVELARGQLWSSVADGEPPFYVSVPDADVESEQGKLNLSCQQGKTEVTVIDGTARVKTRDDIATIHAGQSATIDAGASVRGSPRVRHRRSSRRGSTSCWH